MINMDFLQAVKEMQSALADMVNAMNTRPYDDCKYIYQVDDNKDTYPFQYGLEELLDKVNEWVDDVEDAVEGVDIRNSIAFQESIKLTAMGLDLNVNNFGQQFTLKNGDMTLTFMPSVRGWRNNYNYKVNVVVPVSFGFVTYYTSRSFDTDAFYKQVADIVDSAIQKFNELKTKERYKLLVSLNEATGFQIETRTELDARGRDRMQFGQVTITSDEYDYKKSATCFQGGFREYMRYWKEDILKMIEDKKQKQAEPALEQTA